MSRRTSRPKLRCVRFVGVLLLLLLSFSLTGAQPPELKFQKPRPAVGQNETRSAAMRAFEEGERLLAQATAESLREAIEKYKQALPLFRAIGDRTYEAAMLNKIGYVYGLLGETRKALDYHEQTLALAHAIGNREGEASSHNNIGFLYEASGEKQKALDHFTQALTIDRAAKDREGEAATLNNIGLLYYSTGDPQKALDYYGQALALVRAAGDRGREAKVLEGIGVVYESLGERQKALDYFGKALEVHRAAGDRRGSAVALTNIGVAYFGMGETRKALDYYLQALPLFGAAGDRGGEATALNYIGLTYAALGEWQKALDYYARALPIYRAVGDREGEAGLLNNVGTVYKSLGEKRKALDYLEQALPLFRATGARRDEARTLTNIGNVYDSLGETQKALEYYAQALPITRAVGYPEGEATTLSNIGGAYHSLGDRQKALDYFGQALSLFRAIGDRGSEAAMLGDIGGLYVLSGENRKALDYFVQSLPLRRAAGDRGGEAGTLNNLAATYGALNNRRLAICYLKQSANVYQQLRSNIHGLENTLQKTYLGSVEYTYHGLADLLISEGRLSEAQQVLNAFKDQQYFDLDRTQVRELTPLALTPREREFAARQEKAIETVGEVGGKVAELKRRTAGRPPTEEEAGQLRQLEAQLTMAAGAFADLLKQAETEFSMPADEKDKVGGIPDTPQMQAVLRQLKRDTGQTPVALYTVVGETKFHALIITADGITSASSAISGDELNRKVRELWGLLQSDAYDPTALSKEVYDAVFKPVEAKLPADTKTILWSSDGNLRYVPMAALYDGRRYLVERYNHVYFTRADGERMTRAVTGGWTATGLGTSAAHTVQVLGDKIEFVDLPGVGEEMRLLVRQKDSPRGIFEGETVQDAKFTRAAMLSALRRKRPVVHIASHFAFRTGDEERSFLLMGDGTTFTMAEMKQQGSLFEGVEMLTLSACNTAAQLAGADGREIDAFAELAQRLGANSVMATLWPVADNSTPWLMREFYGARLRQTLNKAEALRRAQLALLQGRAEAVPSPSPRRGGLKVLVLNEDMDKRLSVNTRADVAFVGAKNTVPFKKASNKPFAHPFYWSPFILIGNWR